MNVGGKCFRKVLRLTDCPLTLMLAAFRQMDIAIVFYGFER